MARARLAAHAALILVLLLGASVSAMTGVLPSSAGPAPAAVVGWPPSTGLLVAEVVTGGASASDEFVEITNAGATAADLGGLELVYVTATGGTLTRKAAWTTSVTVEPGRHVLVANVLGAYAGVADATYSGGLAATGGTIVLRPVGGAPVDALGWGDASNAYVEGTAAPAPPAGSSIERKPGGLGGNLVDSNSNASDVVVNAAPAAQNLAAPPVPVPAPSATPSPTPAPSESPSPSLAPSPTIPTTSPSLEPSPTPSFEPSPTPSDPPSPSAAPTPEPSPSLGPTPPPTPGPTPEPSPTASPIPTPGPTPPPTPSPSPTPTPSTSPAPSASPSPTPVPTTAVAMPIADARLLPDGTTALVEGVLTTNLGALEGGRASFVQDAGAGIAIYLDEVTGTALPAGTFVRLPGTVDTRYGQRTLRVAAGDIVLLGTALLPAPLPIATGDAGEAAEGLLVEVTGTVVDSPTVLADGTAVTVDDGSGGVRLVVAPDAGPEGLAKGLIVTARGPLGQRDSSGTGLAGYRVLATLPGDLVVHPPASPSPSPSPSPSASPSPSLSPSPSPAPSSPSPSPSPSPSASASASPSPTPSASPAPVPLLPIAQARTAPAGRIVRVRGAVSAEPGRLGTPALFAIQDATGGIVVKLPEGATPPARGTLVEARGVLADPYGQLEVRPPLDGYLALGPGPAVTPLDLEAGMLGEDVEALLARVTGTVTVAPRKATSGDLTVIVTGEDGATMRVMADASAGIPASALRVGDRATFTGVVGQRASAKGALDGYRLWVRAGADIVKLPPAPVPSAPTPSDQASASPSPVLPTVLAIAQARLLDDSPATVQGVVTAGPTLLDASGRRVVLDDRTGAIEVLLPVDAPAPRVGDGLRVTGTVGRAYGAVRIRATLVEAAPGGTPVPMVLGGAPGPAHEWRLVRVSGTLVDVRRLGDRWVAELRVGAEQIPVTGLPGAGIPSTAIIEGRQATVTGIVRRPYPSASDRRFAVVPRGAGDLAIGPAGSGSGGGAGTSGAGSGSSGGNGSGSGADQGGRGPLGGAPTSPSGAVDIDLGELADHLGALVRVGGLVTAVTRDGVEIDDGTAIGRIVLRGEAAELLVLLQVGDALNAIGRPAIEGGPVLVVDDPAGIRLVGALGEDVALVTPSPEPGASGRTGLGPVRASVARGFGLDAGTAGLGTLGLVALLSVVATVVRRHRSRRLLQARILARIEAIAPARAPAKEDAPAA